MQDDDKFKVGLNEKWDGALGIYPVNLVQEKTNILSFCFESGPPRQIPIALYTAYTMNGKVGVSWWYCDPLRESRSQNKNGETPTIFKKSVIDEEIELVKEKKINYYGDVAGYIHQAFEKYSIKNDKIAIMGSSHPTCEAFCIAYGANPHTIEYNKIICDDERIETYTVEEYYSNPRLGHRPIVCDSGISISSFEHDGLGKYGDPLDPDGDVKAMTRMKETIKPGGLLYLAVPIGKDRIDWNAHRVYGGHRLPVLLEGWELIDSFGFDEKLFDMIPGDSREERPSYGYKHALFVLKNTES